MTSQEIRNKFLNYFKKRGHTVVSSSSLIPADSSVLFTSAGMQQFVPYFRGDVIPPYRRACSVQKCFRAIDIDAVGDTTHHTFFEMLGNWSFGDYFKKGAIEYAWDFFVNILKIDSRRLRITVFKGEKGIPKDEEAIKWWQKAGVPKEKIKEFGMKDNFWGPIAKTGPCGPCSEIYFDYGEGARNAECDIKGCGPNCACGRFVEVWNLVFMEYNKTEKGNYEPLPNKNIDTGIGLERLAAILQEKKSNFETDLLWPLIQELEKLGSRKYKKDTQRVFHIIVDHIRAISFLIADGVLPSKEDRGYVLRRILRRAIRYGKLLGLEENFLIILAKKVISSYEGFYPELKRGKNDILTVIQKEEERFSKTLKKGLKEFERIAERIEAEKKKVISGSQSFHLFDTYGFPLELTKELAGEKGLEVDEAGFKEAFQHHQEISRAGVEKKFGGGGNFGKQVAPHHTATHLLHQALRDVLGKHVRQAGSDLTPERIRFDFTHPTKLTKEEKKKVEKIVNEKIRENLEIVSEEMPYEEAVASGALAFFKEKYPKVVKVYTIRNPKTGEIYSKEVCAGPHVKSTGEIGIFKIKSEKSSGAEVRRIKAILT